MTFFGSKITFLEGKFSKLWDRDPRIFNLFSPPQLRDPGANPGGLSGPENLAKGVAEISSSALCTQKCLRGRKRNLTHDHDTAPW
jgi:hypothetical protein